MITGKSLATIGKHTEPLGERQIGTIYDPETRSDQELLKRLCGASDFGKKCKACSVQCGFGRECVRRFGDNIPEATQYERKKQSRRKRDDVDHRVVAICERIEQAARKKGYHQAEALLKDCNISTSLIYNWKNGIAKPNMGLLLTILDKVGLELYVREKGK